MFAFNRLRVFAIRNKKSFSSQIFKRYCVKYVQGQSPEPRVREYFYYIDHQGMLFLDDSRMKNFTSCFKGVHKERNNLLYITIHISWELYHFR